MSDPKHDELVAERDAMKAAIVAYAKACMNHGARDEEYTEAHLALIKLAR